MKLKSILSILVGIILIVLGAYLIFGGNDSNETPSNNEENNTNVPAEQNNTSVIARIFVYDNTGSSVINTVEITDDTRGKELEDFINQLHPLPENEQVDLALVRNIEIRYGNNTIVSIQNGEDRYCDYSINNGTNFTMSFMPAGLVDWLKEYVL